MVQYAHFAEGSHEVSSVTNDERSASGVTRQIDAGVPPSDTLTWALRRNEHSLLFTAGHNDIHSYVDVRIRVATAPSGNFDGVILGRNAASFHNRDIMKS
jgi:hypothetical protein